jgi:hypothetical protein
MTSQYADLVKELRRVDEDAEWADRYAAADAITQLERELGKYRVDLLTSLDDADRLAVERDAALKRVGELQIFVKTQDATIEEKCDEIGLLKSLLERTKHPNTCEVATSEWVCIHKAALEQKLRAAEDLRDEWCREYAKTRDEAIELRTRCEALEAAAVYGMACFEVATEEYGTLEGDYLQELGVDTGMLEQVTVTEPCTDEGCRCAEVSDFPLTCYRETQVARNARAAIAAREVPK